MSSNKKKICLEEAMIFSAGRGSRMRYRTKFIAKPLIKLRNKELLKVNLDRLRSSKVKHCVINTSYKHYTIKQFVKIYHFRNKSPKISLIHEEQRLETGGGFKNAFKHFNSDNVLLINGDSLLVNKYKDCPIKKLTNNFVPNDMDILLLLVPVQHSIGYKGHGDYIKNVGVKATNIKRKKCLKGSVNNFIFTGWQIINKRILDNYGAKKFSLNKIYDLSEKKNRLYGTTFCGTFLHVSTPKSYLEVKTYLRNHKVKLL